MRAVTTWAAAVLALAAGCSFITDFPGIEISAGAGGGGSTSLGGGGAGEQGGGVTGGGGAGPCTGEACRNCLSGEASCPALASLFTLEGQPSPPARQPTSSVYLTDGVALDAGARFVGTFSGGALGPDVLDPEGATQAGFYVRENGAAVALATVCTDAGGDAPGEVFFTGVAATDSDERVIVGAYEGERMAFFPSARSCENVTTGFSDGPESGEESFTPFLAWLTITDAIDRTFEPASNAPSQGRKYGYLADVVGFGADGPDSVAAIGVAKTDPFTSATFDGSFGSFYVLVSSAPGDAAVSVLPYHVCSSSGFNQLDGLASSIAYRAGDDELWVGGTGCAAGRGDTTTPSSFLGRYAISAGALGALVDSDLGAESAGGSIGVTEIALSQDRVFAAGTYSNQPLPSLADESPIEPGNDDGFVLAFERSSFSASARPVWFTRIVSQGGPATVDALMHAGGRLLVAGSLADGGGIGEAQACFTSSPPSGGRAFVAELDPDDGAVLWLRVDGFEIDQQPLATGAFARGAALVRTETAIHYATRTHGAMQLECEGASTDAQNRPQVHVRGLPP